MMDMVAIRITFEQLLETVSNLTDEQKLVLAERLKLNKQVSENGDHTSPIENQPEARRKPRFAFVNPDALYQSEEEFDAMMHEIGTEWEKELEEFHGAINDADNA